MELFKNIPEFQVKNVFNKYDCSKTGSLSIKDLKLALFFLYGQIVKSSIILKIIRGYLLKKTLNKTLTNYENELKTLLEENSLFEETGMNLTYSNYSYIKELIRVNEVMFESIVENLNKNYLNFSECTIALYNSMLYPNKKNLDYYTFKTQVLKQYPSLNEQFLQNIFFHINTEKTGVISYKEFLNFVSVDKD
jgi:Ca2+-binding EF-hand superfamily protein